MSFANQNHLILRYFWKKMADSTKHGKSQGKRSDENGSLAGLLSGATGSSASGYDPATLLCKLLSSNFHINIMLSLNFIKITF